MTEVLPRPDVRPRTRSGRVAARASLGLAPALVTAVAYVDPGNVATNFSAGSAYGYGLLWVVVGSTVAAGLIQYLSAKLGACTGRSLTQSVAAAVGPRARVAYWIQAELVAVATDIAEVVGGAVALKLLFGLPLWAGAITVAAASTALLHLRTTKGDHAFAVTVAAALALIACGFVACAVFAGPTAAGMLGGMRPVLADSQAVFLASGIFGATVMPHAVYVHSSLSRDSGARLRAGGWFPSGATGEVLSATRRGVVGAMLLAGSINAALLLTAAALPSGTGPLTLEGVHATVGTVLGALPALALALALLVSGLASTAVGTHAGDIAMRDLIRRRVPAGARRLAALAPAVLLLAADLDTTRLLVLSQVGLSLGVPFALIPLTRLTARRSLMGGAVNHWATTVAASAVVAAALAVNGFLLGDLMWG
ncbi:Nramp family divalent metal transporter [Streptomyces sp. NPDC056144]|uniref:Nramp family divalent metal transporter n=1 Tax=unclassified Streptomyces TaxID=2593676 RepID=UPI0035D78F56